ncbi:MAG: N-acetyltransferase [Jannaschia sp.]
MTDIRPVTPADRPRIRTIAENIGLFEPEEVAFFLAAFDDGNGGDCGSIWLVPDAPDIFALAQLAPEPMSDNVWNMLFVGVLSESRRQGVATALLAATETMARERGGRLLLIDTASGEEMAAAHGFYTARGYVREAIIRDYYGDGIDRITYLRRLKGEAQPV